MKLWQVFDGLDQHRPKPSVNDGHSKYLADLADGDIEPEAIHEPDQNRLGKKIRDEITGCQQGADLPKAKQKVPEIDRSMFRFEVYSRSEEFVKLLSSQRLRMARTLFNT